MLRRFLPVMLSLAIVCVSCASSTKQSGAPLTQLHWCSQPTIAFEDDGVTPAATLTTWQAAQPLLGFAPLLPPRLPTSACLVSVGGVVRNTVFGSRFAITYALPNSGALSIVESPKQRDIPAAQCSAGPASAEVIATCQQTQGGLSVTLSSTQTEDQARAILAQLKPNVAWEPSGG